MEPGALPCGERGGLIKMLQKGDVLKTSGGGYDLLICGYLNPRLQQLYREAKIFAGSSQGRARAERFVRYVHQAIRPNLDWNDVGSLVPLQRALHRREGVCKEMAATLDMLLTMEGFAPEYKRGLIPGGRHAWLKVNVGGIDCLADPSTPLFGQYESVLQANGFREGENIVIRNGARMMW